jgi:hypothetical protein
MRTLPRVACAAVFLILAECGSGAPHAIKSSTSPSPSFTATPCGPRMLAADGLFQQQESRKLVIDVALTDTSASSCALAGLPTEIRFVRANGSPLATQYGPNTGATLSTAVLRTGPPGSATVNLEWANWCGRAPGHIRIEVTLPSGAGTVTTDLFNPAYVPRCDSAQSPSTIKVLEAYPRPINGL